MDIFNVKELNELQMRKQYEIKISNRFADLNNLNDREDINRDWENNKGNIKTSAKESLGLHELKQLCSDGSSRGELSYLVPRGNENISAPYFKQCFFQRGGLPPRQSNTTPPSPKKERKKEITNILFYILNFASTIKFKM